MSHRTWRDVVHSSTVESENMPVGKDLVAVLTVELLKTKMRHPMVKPHICLCCEGMMTTRMLTKHDCLMMNRLPMALEVT